VEVAGSRQKPAVHAAHAAFVVAVAPPVEYVPVEHAVPAVVIRVKDATLCDTLTVYPPAPPAPLASAVIVVPTTTPVQLMTCPTTRVPVGAPVTVSVVPTMVPLNAIAPVPAGQYAPAGQTGPDMAPCAQMVPAAHGFAVAPVLAAAVQKPAAQGRHALKLVYVAPPSEYVPTGHALVLPTAWPAPHQ